MRINLKRFHTNDDKYNDLGLQIMNTIFTRISNENKCEQVYEFSDIDISYTRHFIAQK